ncbi:hypothetical protein HK103_007537 [Boothiomyces macroporosus]|uniref:Uncharacterized protein n=1 Tax=Boothiomyces macroporosus TaxID=261099 RepID=A0AAD5UBY1_9FUNG|nr:hypothetical protein HK103_007537 [Boothiomyces macroporosus]
MSIQTITGLLRGAARKPLTSKQGNKNFYKGKRSGRMGHWTRKGHYIVEETQKRTFVIPELVDFKLTPFVSPKANETYRNKHVVADYFEEYYNPGLDEDIRIKCLELAKK